MFGLFKRSPTPLTTKITFLLLGGAALLFALGYALRPVADIMNDDGEHPRAAVVQMDELDCGNDDYAVDMEEDHDDFDEEENTDTYSKWQGSGDDNA